MPMWLRILIGMAMGVATGFLLKEHTVWIAPFGTLFIHMVKMLIVPLILLSVVSAILSLNGTDMLGKLGGGYLAGLVLTCFLAVIVGISVAQVIQPGDGMEALVGEQPAPPIPSADGPGYERMITGIAPQNIIAAMAEGNILQVLFFAIFLGLAIRTAGEKAAPVAVWIESLNHIMYRVTALVLWFAPFGVFALMAGMVATQDLLILKSLGKLIASLYIAAGVLVAIYGVLLAFVGMRLSEFLRASAGTLLFAASSTSSAATLPMTLKAGEQLGIRDATAHFVLPIGVSTNMHGTVLNLCVVTLFVAQGAGIDLSFAQYGMLALACLFASFATAGVPNAGVIMLSFMLTAVGLPIVAVPLVIGIYRLLDMVITPLNVLGDLLLAVLLDRYTLRSDGSRS